MSATIPDSSFPRISAGSLATVLMQEVLLLCGNTQHMTSIRSRDVIQALKDGNIDMAIVHDSSLDHAQGMVVKELLSWKAVLVSPKVVTHRSPDYDQRLHTFTWEEGTFADSILNKYCRVNPKFSTEPTAKGVSFLISLEIIRRNLPYQMVLPDIYLSDQDWQTLEIDDPDPGVGGNLVAVYGEGKAVALAPYIDPLVWRKACPAKRKSM